MDGVGVIPAVDGLRGIGIFQCRFQTHEKWEETEANWQRSLVQRS